LLIASKFLFGKNNLDLYKKGCLGLFGLDSVFNKIKEIYHVVSFTEVIFPSDQVF